MGHHWVQSVLFLVGLAGCATTAWQPGEPMPARGIITRLEMERSGIQDAYEAVRLFSGRFVRPGELGGVSGLAVLPVVFVDGIRAVGFDALRDIPTSQVSEIRLVRGSNDATYDFRTIAVVVTTARPD